MTRNELEGMMQGAQAAFTTCCIGPLRKPVAQRIWDEISMAWRKQRDAALADKAAAQQFVEFASPRAAVLQTLAGLSYDDQVRTAGLFDGTTRPLTEVQRALIERHPALVAWQADRVAKASNEDAQTAVLRERARLALDEAAPEKLRAEIRSAGITLGLDQHGKITAHPGALLSVEQLDGIVAHKAALAAMLRAEAQSARPMVVA